MMRKLIERSSTSPSGGKSIVMTYDAVAGVSALIFAVVATTVGVDISVWHCAVAGLAGVTGAYFFINPETANTKAKIISLLCGAAMASLFGPLVARGAGHYLLWIGDVNYFVTASGGFLVGLLSTPVLRFIHNPVPALTLLASFIPFWGQRHKKD